MTSNAQPSRLFIPNKLSSDPRRTQQNGVAIETFVNGNPYQAYNPQWNGTIGNGVETGRFICWGKSCTVSIVLGMGSTTVGPAAQWTVELPLPTGNIQAVQAFTIVAENDNGNVMGYATTAGTIATQLSLYLFDPVGSPPSFYAVTDNVTAGNLYVITGTYETQ